MTNFLCTRCRACMCQDCLEIADEYHELERNRARNQFLAERDNFRLKQELERVQKERQMWEDLAKLPFPGIIQRWMDTIIEEKRNDLSAPC